MEGLSDEADDSATLPHHEMATQVRLINVKDFSDGNRDHAPNTSTHKKYDPPTIYLEKLGTAWMEHLSKAQPGVVYRLNKLPAGYTIWEKPRPGNPKHIDRWCYGHPSGKTFDSPNRFLPHFLSLMEDANTDYCKCVHCDGSSRPGRKPKATTVVGPAQRAAFASQTLPSRPSGRPPGRPPGRPVKLPTEPHTDRPASDVPELPTNTGVYRAKGRQWVDGRTDEEGTPDPYRNNIDRLRKLGAFDTLIEEPMSVDWRAEKAGGIDAYFKEVKSRPAWQPRRMEIVLFVRDMQSDERLVFDPATKKFLIHGRDDHLRKPLWEAGVVTQTAIMPKGALPFSVTTNGYRVEPLSNANKRDGKGIWKQYTYLRADQIRPLSLWKNLLSGLETSAWHPTIENAMLVMATVTLVKRYRFKGKWPEAKIYCRGMYIGSELILEGDFVYLVPDNESMHAVTDVMKVDAITLDMWSLDKSSSNDYDEGHPYNCAVRITGRIYTTIQEQAFDTEPVELNSIATNTKLDFLGPWYARTPGDKLARIPFHRVMGRCHDPDVVEQWLHGDRPGQDLVTKPGVGLSGVLDARVYSSTEYRKIDEDRSWYWADTRVQALDLEEVNGLTVSSQDPDRDPKRYRKEIRVIEGTARPEERLSLQQTERLASIRGVNSMIASALKIDADDDSKEVSRERKRDRSAFNHSDEEEESMEENEDEVGPGTTQRKIVDQILQGMNMSDEVPSGRGEEMEFSSKQSKHNGTFRSQPVVIIDD